MILRLLKLTGIGLLFAAVVLVQLFTLGMYRIVLPPPPTTLGAA